MEKIQSVLTKLRQQCDHPIDCRVVEVYGGVSYEGGECVDTTETVLICTKCGQTIVEEVKEELLF